MIFINSAALNKIRRTAGTCHSVLTKRCAFRRRAKVAVDSVDRRSSADKLFQVSGPETAKFLRPMAVSVYCMSSLLEAADCRCRYLVRWMTGRQSSARYRVRDPADICWPASRSCIVSAGQPQASEVLKWCHTTHWRGRIYGLQWSSTPWRSELLRASEERNQRLQLVDYCNRLTSCWRKHEQVSWPYPWSGSYEWDGVAAAGRNTTCIQTWRGQSYWVVHQREHQGSTRLMKLLAILWIVRHRWQWPALSYTTYLVSVLFAA